MDRDREMPAFPSNGVHCRSTEVTNSSRGSRAYPRKTFPSSAFATARRMCGLMDMVAREQSRQSNLLYEKMPFPPVFLRSR